MPIRRLPTFALPVPVVLFLAACSVQTPPPAAAPEASEPERSYVEPRTAADATLPPFSGAVLTGNTLYVSGHIGVDDQQRVPETAEAEAASVLDQVKATIEQAGMTMDDLVYVQVFCSDVSNYDAFNTVYRRYFQKEFPSRAFVGVGTLLFGARFEVQGIAVRR